MTVELKAGGHLSIRRGYAGAAEEAGRQGAGAFQYFPKNPRSLTVKAFDRRDAERCRSICQSKGIVSVAHTPYPSNLAIGPDEDRQQYERTILSLRNDLEIAEACGSVGIVVHFGTYKGRDILQGYQNIVQCINEVLHHWQGNAKLLIENQAGDHGDMGMTLEELVQIRKLSDYSDQIGFCLDTCHAFASGLWGGVSDDRFASKAEELGYLDGLHVVHFNDSQYPARSRKDRHARIGQGAIGEEGFRQLLQIKAIREKPLILESETGEDGTYREDLQRIRSLAEV